jgi:alkylhydroperoxidase family enzyme
VSAQVKPKEDAIFGGDPSALTAREALAIELAERIAGDPHTITSAFWDKLKEEFTDDELVELSFACSIFNWGNKFNITMQLDTDGTTYASGMEYREVGD